MTTEHEPDRNHAPRAESEAENRFGLYRWIAFAMAVAAAGISAYITFTPEGDLLGCDAATGIGCGEVLHTRWSQWLGLPVGVAGLFVYVSLAVLLALMRRGGPFPLRTGALALSALAAGSGLWFAGVQLFEIRAVCAYCMTVHMLGLGAFIVLTMGLLGVRASGRDSVAAPGARLLTFSQASLAILAGLFGVGLLIAGQVQNRFAFEMRVVDRTARPASTADASSPAESHSPADLAPSDIRISAEPGAQSPTLAQPAASAQSATTQSPSSPAPPPVPPALAAAHAFAPPRPIALLDGKLAMMLGEYPVIGDPAAPHVIATLFDYTCPACRQLHTWLEDARARYGGRLAVVQFPMPLDATCNPAIEQTSYGHRNACLFGKMALAVWNTKPDAFAEFHDAMFERDFPPTAEEAWSLAAGLVGEDDLARAMQEPVFEKMLQFSINLFYSPLVEKKVLPVLLTEGEVRLGNPESPEELYEFLEAQLGIEPTAAAEVSSE